MQLNNLASISYFFENVPAFLRIRDLLRHLHGDGAIGKRAHLVCRGALDALAAGHSDIGWTKDGHPWKINEIDLESPGSVLTFTPRCFCEKWRWRRDTRAAAKTGLRR